MENVTIVYGYVTTWKITEKDGKYNVMPGDKSYSSIAEAKRAIRTAEQNYVKEFPNAKVVNRNIWFDHNVLVVAGVDHGYYD